VAERAHQFTPHKQCICSVIRELTWARNVALVVRGGMSEGGAARVTRRDHPDLPDFGTILPVEWDPESSESKPACRRAPPVPMYLVAPRSKCCRPNEFS